MKVVVFNPSSGASGDMIVGSLLDLGADHEIVKSAMESFSTSVSIGKTKKRGISATKVNVESSKEHRAYDKVVKIVDGSGLDRDVIENSLKIFELIADAESTVHDTAKEDMIFHEIGADDAIADVVGSCAAFRDLNLDKYKIYSTQISVGGGFVETSHGNLPVPAPATLEILRNSSLLYQGGPAKAELLTPTGAAILAHLVDASYTYFPPIVSEAIGYGAGDLDLSIPNVLRVISGYYESLKTDEIEVLETNVDDVTGEVLGNLIDELLKEGARDVAIIPCMMKKGRSGHIIQALSKPNDTYRVARKIIEETGSLGVRVMPTKHRLITNRSKSTVKFDIGGEPVEIGVKISTDTNGNLLNTSAEFDDAKRIAAETGIPLREIIRCAEETAWNKYG